MQIYRICESIASLNLLRRRAWAWCSISIFSALFIFIPLTSLIIIVSICLHPSNYWQIACGWILMGILPHSNWPGFRHFFCQLFVKPWQELFEFRIVMDGDEVPLQMERGYLLCVHPHGIVPIGGMGYICYLTEHFPHIYGRTGVASIVLRQPIFRQMFSWLGFVDASLDTVQSEIEAFNFCLLPGGIAELLLSSREEETLFLQKRRGFLNVAHKAGARIVPSYVFGNTAMFDQLSTGQGWLSRLSRRFRLSITYFWGQFGLPIPFPARVTMVFGQPFVTTGDIEADSLSYVAALTALFDKYKHYAGYGNRKLQVL
jgi:hypothetical protein